MVNCALRSKNTKNLSLNSNYLIQLIVGELFSHFTVQSKMFRRSVTANYEKHIPDVVDIQYTLCVVVRHSALKRSNIRESNRKTGKFSITKYDNHSQSINFQLLNISVFSQR